MHQVYFEELMSHEWHPMLRGFLFFIHNFESVSYICKKCPFLRSSNKQRRTKINFCSHTLNMFQINLGFFKITYTKKYRPQNCTRKKVSFYNNYNPTTSNFAKNYSLSWKIRIYGNFSPIAKIIDFFVFF